jgi:endonuclease-8
MAVASLGPDVLADDFDPVVAAERAAGHLTRSIADVLLDQRVAAGIGNIWKCESLFACGVDPRRAVSSLDAATLIALYAAARDLMRASVAGQNPRGEDQFFVYSRTGKPCRRCKTPIDCYQLGSTPRWTWSCAVCQPRGGGPIGVSR